MALLNLLNQPIVLVDLFIININLNFFYFGFIFSAYFVFKVNSDYFSSGTVFLAISPLVPCGDTAFKPVVFIAFFLAKKKIQSM